MVNRPPPKSNSNGFLGDSMMDHRRAAYANSRNNGSSGLRRGLEWSLRGLHKIDNGAHHFLNSYYEDDHESNCSDDEEKNPLEDQSAYDIFKGEESTMDRNSKKRYGDAIWSTLHVPLREGIVDGKKCIFELHSNVTQRPTKSRKERLYRKHVIKNANKSSLEVRIRFWMMHFSVFHLSWAFLAVFILLNVIFAGLFYGLNNEHCCGDSSQTFGQVFAFSIQTSTTIGYGGYTPQGYISNFLVVLLSYSSTLINTLFAGLLFTKFVTPVINIQFSDVMTLCNVNGVPCLSFRLGNADGHANPLTDINVRLSYSYRIPYHDHNGELKYFRQTEDLKLLSNRQHGLWEVWTLRHVLDESSPLFGLHFQEHPANRISNFTVSLDAVQDLTKSSVNIQTEYAIEDVLIGHSFCNTLFLKEVEEEENSSKKTLRRRKNDLKTTTTRTTTDSTSTSLRNKTETTDPNNTTTRRNTIAISDYSKMSETEPYPVWYPALSGTYGND